MVKPAAERVDHCRRNPAMLRAYNIVKKRILPIGAIGFINPEAIG